MHCLFAVNPPGCLWEKQTQKRPKQTLELAAAMCSESFCTRRLAIEYHIMQLLIWLLIWLLIRWLLKAFDMSDPNLDLAATVKHQA